MLTEHCEVMAFCKMSAMNVACLIGSVHPGSDAVRPPRRPDVCSEGTNVSRRRHHWRLHHVRQRRLQVRVTQRGPSYKLTYRILHIGPHTHTHTHTHARTHARTKHAILQSVGTICTVSLTASYCYLYGLTNGAILPLVGTICMVSLTAPYYYL